MCSKGEITHLKSSSKHGVLYVSDSNTTLCESSKGRIEVLKYNNCSCHSSSQSWKSNKTREALLKLSFAAFLAIVFTIAEAVGGYLSSSLAVLTDSAHMLSDFFGFIVSLVSLIISKRKPNKKMHFGFYRAEVLGAVFSVVIIWIVTALLVYEGIQRVIHLDYDINADVMLITATAGLYINVLLSLVLLIPVPKFLLEKDVDNTQPSEKVENINIRAALIHCIGDIVQSIGVIIAGVVIRFRPEWKVADPICTFVFSILVTITTINILRDAVHILMEGAPGHIKDEEIKALLFDFPGVEKIHDLRVWNVNSTRLCISVHLVVDMTKKSEYLLESVLDALDTKFNIDFPTIQIEDINSGGYLNCPLCLDVDKIH